MKIKQILMLVLVVALILGSFAIGHYFGAKKTSFQAEHFILVEGTFIQGKITSITAEDISEITKLIGNIEDSKPILSIEVTSENHVEVKTGEVRGPLDGGGNIYELKKNKSKWELVNPKMIKSWVS